jgi:hypothetical protein
VARVVSKKEEDKFFPELLVSLDILTVTCYPLTISPQMLCYFADKEALKYCVNIL